MIKQQLFSKLINKIFFNIENTSKSNLSIMNLYYITNFVIFMISGLNTLSMYVLVWCSGMEPQIPENTLQG